MGNIKRTFDTQFKVRVCEAIRSRQKSAAAVCREYQIAQSVLYRWLDAFDAGTLGERTANREQALERENEKLKAKIGELTMQIDVLKKIQEWKQLQRNAASSIITESNLAQFQRPAEPPASPCRRTTTKRKTKR